MKKLVLIVVVLLFATATFAVAAEQKVVSTGPVQMTDAEMAQVVGGAQRPTTIGSGYYLNYAINELYNLTYSLPLSKYEQSLIRDKLYCLSNIIGGKTKIGFRPPPQDL